MEGSLGIGTTTNNRKLRANRCCLLGSARRRPPSGVARQLNALRFTARLSLGIILFLTVRTSSRPPSTLTVTRRRREGAQS